MATSTDPNVFIKNFTDRKIEDMIEIGDSFYKVDKGQKELIDRIKSETGKEPKHAGIFLGEVKNRKFLPSVALFDMIATWTERKIVIDKKSEWLFLCGRDIFGKSILKAGVTAGKVLVQNQKREILGCGKIVADLSKKEKVVVKNILDKGDFLRRER